MAQTRRLTGSRIRERRLDRGLRQAALAEAVGISPSYLNLIEHNRRRIGGELLEKLAEALAVDPAHLLDGADASLLEALHRAAARGEGGAELQRAEDFAGRFPGWARLVAAQEAALVRAEAQVRAMSDRMTHDPNLALALHDVISAVTAIRATASILVEQEDLDADWRQRFHANIHADARRLTARSEALVAYLEAPETAEEAALSPAELVESWLAEREFHLPALEGGKADPAALTAEAGLPGSASGLLKRVAEQYARDAAALPLARFEAALAQAGADPAALAARFGVPFAQVLRRLAALPPSEGRPAMGLAVCDGSGALTFLKTAGSFRLSRGGGGCPLWPIYAALARPAQPIRARVALPDPMVPPMLAYAVGEAEGAGGFDSLPLARATMLVLPDAVEATPGPVIEAGLTCRICPRENCPARREPAMEGIGAL